MDLKKKMSDIKEIRKQIRESDNLIETLEKLTKKWKLCTVGFYQDLPIETIDVWKDGKITIYFYLMGLRTFKNKKLFSYNITEIRPAVGYDDWTCIIQL